MVEVQSGQPAPGRHPGLVGRTGVNLGDEAGSCLPRGWHLWTVLYALLPLVLTRLLQLHLTDVESARGHA